MSAETLEQTFQVSSPAHLRVGNIRGSVVIRPGEEGVIRVMAVKRAGSGDQERTLVEMRQDSDGTVNVHTRFPDGVWSWMFGSFPCNVDYTITVPVKCSLKLNGVSNSVDTQGMEGEFSFSTVSGDVRMHTMTGPIHIHAVSGEVSAEKVSGSLDLDTVSGDVDIKNSSLVSIVSNTVSAKLFVQGSLGVGPYHFNAVSGNTRLLLPPDSHFMAELRTVSGQIISAFPVGAYTRSNGAHTIQVRGGGVALDLQSISGDVILDCDGVVPQADSPQTTSAQERRQVLESIERGEMTVDEALSKLHG